jgi:hypothetical protein
MSNRFSVSCINETDDLDDIISIVEIDKERRWKNSSALRLIDKLKTELVFLIKNEQQEAVWYALMDKVTDWSSHRLYSLFIIPDVRNQGAWTATLAYILREYWVKTPILIDIHPQEDYTRNFSEYDQTKQRRVPAIDQEKLIRLVKKNWFILKEEKADRYTARFTAPTTTPPTDADTWSSSDQ